jgi:hypothetical protein
MSLWIEITPPFVWRPKIERAGVFTGVLWGWFRIGHIPCDFNEFVLGIAEAGRALPASQRQESGE